MELSKRCFEGLLKVPGGCLKGVLKITKKGCVQITRWRVSGEFQIYLGQEFLDLKYVFR